MTPRAEIEDAIKQFFHSMDTQDLDLMKRLVAHDANMVHIGTESDEIWKGWNKLHKATVEQFEGLQYYKAMIKNLQINFSSSGKVAWYSHLLDARVKSNGQERTWKDARFTGVYEKRDNCWLMVQTHVSLPESP